MVDYKEAKKRRQTIVLIKGDEVISTFGSLKKAVEYINKEDGTTLSYWSLSRNAFPIQISGYMIWKVRHY